LPYGIGDWYWLPSRAIPAPGDVEPITEFPFFTVLYADLHAHLLALPITLLALAFALAVVLGMGRWKGFFGAATGFLLGGLAIGVLRPTNTWDFYTYLALGCVAVGYTFWKYYQPGESRGTISLPTIHKLPILSQRFLAAAGGISLLVFLSLLLFKPFSDWYALGYNKVDLWKYSHTMLSAYLVHWGVFLFLIVSWMIWETRDWLASTPLSSLRKLEPYKLLIQFALLVLLLLVVGLLLLKVGIAWLVLPLAAWAGVLLLRPGISDAKRFVLFLVGTGLVLTLMVEVIVLLGDIGRMNTVFKFYLQVWTLFSISAAASLGWLIPALPVWRPGWRVAWQVVLVVLVASAALYPLMATMAKIQDRMTSLAPHTLDGMAYMRYAEYADDWGIMDLSQDYRAIRWMQENVLGSPVIVEANLRNLYRWGSRFSIYTGLPGVVGWEWHQQQQRAVLPGNWVSDRIAEVDNFYQTTDLQQALDFLRKYNVRYIILGQQERGHYPGEGLNKFEAANGMLWKDVYRDGDTVIYEVPPQ
jgi:YYY domain-containing protein